MIQGVAKWRTLGLEASDNERRAIHPKTRVNDRVPQPRECQDRSSTAMISSVHELRCRPTSSSRLLRRVDRAYEQQIHLGSWSGLPCGGDSQAKSRKCARGHPGEPCL